MSCREAPIRAREAVVRFKAQLADAKANILNQARDVEVRGPSFRQPREALMLMQTEAVASRLQHTSTLTSKQARDEQA